MADIESNIRIDIDTSSALGSIKALQSQISAFQKQMARGSAASATNAQSLQRQLIGDINATGRFAASMRTVKSTTESFTDSLEKNKFSMGQYFRFAGASTKTFGKLFTSEFNTLDKVARERVKTLQTQYVSMGRDANGALQSIAVRPLTLDMNNLGTQTALTAQKQQLFNQLLRQGSTNLLNFGKNTQWAGRQLMVGFTIPLSIMGSMAAKEFRKLEEQSIRFRRVYGDLFTTPEQTDAALEDMRDLAKQFTSLGVAVEDTVALAAKVAQMGNTGAMLRAQVTEATRLSILGGMEQQAALDTTIGLTNAFGVSIEDLTNKVNFLNAAENQTILSIQDFNDAVPRAGSVVRQLGGDVEDLALFLTAMREGGIEATQGANALKSSLGRLINPTDAAKKRLGGFGIDIVKIVDSNVGNLRATVLELGSELDKLDPLSRARAIETLFGKFQFARMATLFNNIQKEGSQAARVLDIIGLSAEEMGTIATRELGRVEESVATKFTKSLEQFKFAIAPIGEEFLKLATPILEFGSKVLDAFNNLDSGAKSFIVGAIGVLGGIAPLLLMLIGLTANFAANAIKLFGNLRLLFLRLTGGSKMLTEQTSYMNQEQLEAAAVAASLDQTHSKLIQTFNVEALAVDRLSAAYNKMVAAQARSMGAAIPTTVGGRQPRKMKDGGVVSVPGPKGAGDIIPAMLTPGEAVIPAEMVQKYGGLIQGMISDNIPGFNEGTSGGIHRSHLTMPFEKSSPQFKDSIRIHGLEELNRQFPDFIRVVSNLVAELPASLNQKLVDGASIKDFEDGWDSRTGKLKMSAQLGGMENTPENQKALSEIETQIKDRAIQLAKGTKEQKIKDELLSEATRQVIDEKKKLKGATGNAAKALDRSSKQIGEIRIGGEKETVLSGLDSGTLHRETFDDKAPRVFFEDQEVARESKSKPGKLYHASSIRPPTSYAKVKGNMSEEAAAAESLQAAKKKSAAANKEELAANKNTATSKKKQATAQKSERAADTDLKTANRRQAVSRERERDPATGRFASAPITTEGAATTPGGVGAIAAPVADTTQRLAKMNSSLMGASFALTSLAGVGSMMGGAIGELSQKVFAFSGVLFALMQITQLLTQAKFLELLQRQRTLAIDAVAGSALAGKAGLIPMLGRAGISVGKFLGPIGIAIGLLTALGFGIKFVLDKQKEQRQAIEGLGKTANLAEKQLKSLGDLFGVTARSADFSSRFRQPAGTADQVSLTQQVLQSENFSEDFGTQITAIENATKDRAEIALRSLSLQLASSGFATEHVEAIIRAIATEAGRKDLNLSFAGISIDLGEGISDVVNDAISEFTNALEQPGAITTTEIRGHVWNDPDFGLVQDVHKDFSADAKQAAEMLAGVYTTSFASLNLELEDGTIKAEEFNESMSEMLSGLLGLDNAQIVIPNILESLEIAEAASGLTNIEDQLTAIQAAAAGVNVSEMVTDLQRLREEEDAMANKTGPEAESQLGRIRLERARLTSGIAAQTKATEELATEEARSLTDSDMRAAIDSNREKLEVFDQLIKAGLDEAEALEMSNDEKWRALTLEALEKDLLPDLIRLREDYNGSIADLPESQNTATVALRKSIEELEKQVDVYEWLISNGMSVAEAQKAVGDSALYAAAAEAMLADASTDAKDSLQIPENIRNVATAWQEYAGDAMEAAAANAALAGGANFDQFLEKVERMGELTERLSFGKNSGSNQEEENPFERALSSLQDQRKEIIDSRKAYDGLRKSGMDIANAFEMAKDPLISAALASQQVGSKEWNRLYKEIILVNGMMEKRGIQDLIKTRAADIQLTGAFAKIAPTLSKMGLSAKQIDDILSDKGLAKEFIKDLENGQVNAKLIRDFLNQIKIQERIDLRIRLSSPEGVQEWLSDYSGAISSATSKATEFFEAQTKIAEQDFFAGTNIGGFNDDLINIGKIIKEIEETNIRLDDYRFDLRNLEHDLSSIKDQEDEINKRYEKRLEALGDVLKANSDIADQQKSQLDIVSALSSGDIAAAAKAVQEQRLRAAQREIETRESAIQRQRESELQRVRSTDGRTRAQLEEDILSLTKQISEEEVKSLAPSERRLSIAERLKDTALEAIGEGGYLGKTETAWKAIEDAARLAVVQSDAFRDSLISILKSIPGMSFDVDGNVKFDQEKFKEGIVGGTVAEQEPQDDATRAARTSVFQAKGVKVLDRDAAAKAAISAVKTGRATDPLAFANQVRAQVLENRSLARNDATSAAEKARLTRENIRLMTTTGLKFGVGGMVPSYKRLGGLIPYKREGGLIPYKREGGLIPYKRLGGLIPYKREGGLIPYKANGGLFQSINTDTVPAMLTPGEFVIRRHSVQKYGTDKLGSINNGTYNGESVYNYNLSVNVKSEANPNEIAKTVMTQIRQVDSMRLRGNRF